MNKHLRTGMMLLIVCSLVWAVRAFAVTVGDCTGAIGNLERIAQACKNKSPCTAPTDCSPAEFPDCGGLGQDGHYYTVNAASIIATGDCQVDLGSEYCVECPAGLGCASFEVYSLKILGTCQNKCGGTFVQIMQGAACK